MPSIDIHSGSSSSAIESKKAPAADSSKMSDVDDEDVVFDFLLLFDKHVFYLVVLYHMKFN